MEVTLTPQIANKSSIPLKHVITIIGRNEDADIKPGDMKVSRIHAAIVNSSEKVVVRDLCSTNGTKINGKKISGTLQLHNQDKVTFGDATYLVHIKPKSGGEIPLKPDSSIDLSA